MRPPPDVGLAWISSDFLRLGTHENNVYWLFFWTEFNADVVLLPLIALPDYKGLLLNYWKLTTYILGLWTQTPTGIFILCHYCPTATQNPFFFCHSSIISFIEYRVPSQVSTELFFYQAYPYYPTGSSMRALLLFLVANFATISLIMPHKFPLPLASRREIKISYLPPFLYTIRLEWLNKYCYLRTFSSR